MSDKPENMYDGIILGGFHLKESIGDGINDMYNKPVDGWNTDDKYSGVLIGIGEGMCSLVGNTITGTIVLGKNIVKGCEASYNKITSTKD